MRDMKGVGVVFSLAEVKRLAQEKKREFRRIVTPSDKTGVITSINPHGMPIESAGGGRGFLGSRSFVRDHCPYGMPKDPFWVKEPWSPRMNLPSTAPLSQKRRYCCYKADDGDLSMEYHPHSGWKSAATMPAWACRWWCSITAVRAERLRSVSFPASVKAEGYEDSYTFLEDWTKAFKPQERDPIVWVVSFKAFTVEDE